MVLLARGRPTNPARDYQAHYVKTSFAWYYAAQGDDATVASALAGAKQLEFVDGTWAYRDLYFGMTIFSGIETVAFNGAVIWAMSYSGGMDLENATGADVQATYRFLRRALSAVTVASPFRGQPLERDGWRYQSTVIGDIGRFRGTELVSRSGATQFSLSFSGGAIQ